MESTKCITTRRETAARYQSLTCGSSIRESSSMFLCETVPSSVNRSPKKEKKFVISKKNVDGRRKRCGREVGPLFRHQYPVQIVCGSVTQSVVHQKNRNKKNKKQRKEHRFCE